MWGKNYRNKISFCGSNYIIEPKYRLFYISEDGEDFSTCRVQKNILKIEMHRPFGKDIFGRNVVSLENGDIFKIIVHNFKTIPNRSILEKSMAVSSRYISYKGNGIFEELDYSKCKRISYVTLYNEFSY